MKFIAQILLLSIVISYGAIASTGDVVIKTKAEPSSPLVGQKVTLTIDVLARDGWATISPFPPLEVAGAYLHRYETQGTRLNENHNGASYSGQRYEVLLFAQKAGELTVDSFPVEVSIKTWGADATTKSEKLSTEPVILSVSSPGNVTSGEYLPVTTKLDAKQTWSSQEKAYKLGDAIERTVTRKAEDVSAMVFAPLDLPGINGLSCYPSQPEVNDSFNRGVLVGTRVDKISCILEQPGGYTFPEIAVSFWNIATEKMEVLVLPGISFTAKDSAGGQPSGSRTSSNMEDNRNWQFIAAGMSLLCISVWFFRKELSAFIQKRHEKRKYSEKYLFRKIHKTLKAGDRHVMLAAIISWLDQLPGMKQPTRLDEFAKRFGSEEMVLMLKDLYGNANWTETQCRTLYEFLRQGRKSYLHLNKGRVANIPELPSVGLGSSK